MIPSYLFSTCVAMESDSFQYLDDTAQTEMRSGSQRHMAWSTNPICAAPLDPRRCALCVGSILFSLSILFSVMTGSLPCTSFPEHHPILLRCNVLSEGDMG